jgi:hypothetical protein
MSHTDPPPPEASAGHGDDLLHNPDVAHEQSDVNVRALLAFAVGLVVATAAIFVLMGWLFNFLERRAAANDPAISPLARPATQMPTRTTGSPYFGDAPGPRLLIGEPAALRNQREMEDERLETYGWVDEKSGIARIPVSEAEKLILQRGLPARAHAVHPWLGTHSAAYGGPSGGRMIPTGEKTEEATKEQGPSPAPAPTQKEHGK